MEIFFVDNASDSSEIRRISITTIIVKNKDDYCPRSEIGVRFIILLQLLIPNRLKGAYNIRISELNPVDYETSGHSSHDYTINFQSNNTNSVIIW
ncbi:hypothetical protein NPIL_343061 [Nephila pilipes]|uniref:Uncharacterized protein n=1 Tax=Nephila pilipes TaxID=299642 RepID=A0A8X6P9V3_NEPPI|nr:hypothetical protein NPIL_343061 [Nephila pilipes]